VPVIPTLDPSGAALDMSLCVTRAVSPIHIEYLRNMGVGASLSISIIVDGKLWGCSPATIMRRACPVSRNAALPNCSARSSR